MRNWGAGMSVSGIAALAGAVGFGAWWVLWCCRGACTCLSLSLRICRCCLRSALWFCRGGLRSVRGWRYGSVVVFCPRFMSGDAALLGRLPSVHACCLPHGDKQDGLRYLAFLFRRVEIAIRAFSICRRGYLPWWVHFGFGRFFVAISTRRNRNARYRKPSCLSPCGKQQA